MSNNNNISVYELITKLSHKFASQQKRYNVTKYTKLLRSKAYNIILYKKYDRIPKDHYTSIPGIYNKIRGWLFSWKLTNGYENEQMKMIDYIIDKLEKCKEEHLDEILTILFQLRKRDIFALQNPFILPIDEDFPFPTYPSYKFNMLSEETPYKMYNNNMFKFNETEDDLIMLISHEKVNNHMLESERNASEDTDESETSIDIWDYVLDPTIVVPVKNWESGDCYVNRERIKFVTESPENYDHLLRIANDSHTLIDNTVSLEDFIRDVTYVLVGIQSKSFKQDNNKQFSDVSVSIKSCRTELWNQHCTIYIDCGNKYTHLDNLINRNKMNRKQFHKGYIYHEFENCIKRYLYIYNCIVFAIPLKNALNNVKRIAEQLHSDLKILTDIVNGIFVEDFQRNDCVKMLNYLYDRLYNFSDTRRGLVLFIFYPCLQVYYSHFLQPWLFDGTINDPYNEFFVNRVTKYVQNYDRIYWKKCFAINNSKVPNFLIDSKDQILLCGKSVHVLKICNSRLKQYDEDLSTFRPNLTCCITDRQLRDYIFNVNRYKLKIFDLFGKPFSLNEELRDTDENRDKFLTMVAYKRTTTLKRIELEKINKLKIENERKQKEVNVLKEQYYDAISKKHSNLLTEIAREIKESEIQMQNEDIKNQVLEEEAKNMIDYYDNLMQEADLRKQIAEQHVAKWKTVQLFFNDTHKSLSAHTVTDVEELALNCATELLDDDLNRNNDVETKESVISASELNENEEERLHDTIANNNILIPEETRTTTLDIMNANNVSNVKTTIVLDNFEMARRNKAKVMSSEFDVLYKSPECKTNKSIFTMTDNLTEAQRNRLKVMGSEFHIDYNIKKLPTDVDTSTDTAAGGDNNERQILDNSTINPITATDVKSNKRSPNLQLDFTHLQTRSIFEEFLKPPNFELNKMTPMSIDSTPMSDLTPLSNIRFNRIDLIDYDNSPLETGTATSSKDEFNFYINNNNNNNNDNNVVEPCNPLKIRTFSNTISLDDAKEINETQIQLFIEQSVNVILTTQSQFIDNELMRYYVNELNYLKLLKTLRNYYFLMDGEFCKNLVGNMFEKVYEIDNPTELLNVYTLQLILANANEESSDNLSFKINRIPERFDLRDPNLLKCISLTFKINWPLNVLLPSDTLAKYNDIFHFLMKLQRVTWILKTIFLDLKMLGKQLGRKSAFLAVSPQYQALHRYRHVMTQFVQSYQCYIVGDILQTSWKLFENSITSSSCLDSLYESHTRYIKDILSKCFLNEASARISDVLDKIFVTIFQFYDYLRSRLWIQDEDTGTFTHPNYKKLESAFRNFEELISYFYKVIHKAVTSNYQIQLQHLITTCDINNFHQIKLNLSTPLSKIN